MSKKKQFYEKPVSVDAGKIASVLGAICSDGGVATDGCVEGNDPHVSPTCTPGATASFHCDTGSTNNTTWRPEKSGDLDVAIRKLAQALVPLSFVSEIDLLIIMCLLIRST